MPVFFTFVGATLQMAVVWALWRRQILSVFPLLACFLMVTSLWAFTSLAVDSQTSARFWNFGAGLSIVVLVGAFVETIYRSLEHYPGLSTRVILGACGIVAAVSAVFGSLEPTHQLVRVLLVVQRVSGAAVAVGAIGVALLLNYLDPRRRANVIRHERIMAGMAATTAASAWLSNQDYPAPGAVLLYAGNIIFPLLWLWALRAEGEIDVRPPSNPAGMIQAKMATDQLRGYYEE